MYIQDIYKRDSIDNDISADGSSLASCEVNKHTKHHECPQATRCQPVCNEAHQHGATKQNGPPKSTPTDTCGANAQDAKPLEEIEGR